MRRPPRGTQDLRDALDSTRGRRGNSVRAQLLLDSRAEPWSVPARMAHALLREARIGGWRANAPVRIGPARYYVDNAFPSHRLVIEIDGRELHIGAEVFESDRVGQNRLVTNGWTVLRFPYGRLLTDPDEVLEEIRAAPAMIEAARR